MTHWMWFAAGIGTVVAALMVAALVSRWFRVPAAHRAGIDEDEDDPEPAPRQMLTSRRAKPIGRDTASLADEDDPEPEALLTTLRIAQNLYARGHLTRAWSDTEGLGPPPTYPETPEEHTP
jgi:hypothetical protein